MSSTRTRLELRQSQRLSLTPELQQSLGLLALSGASLEELIAETADDNPFLIFSPQDSATRQTASAYDVAMLTVAARPSLGEHLCGQLALMNIDPDVVEAAMTLAYDLDQNGFFTQSSASELAKEHNLSEPLVRKAVAALQCCEPTGIAAFSLSECISLQLLELGIDPARFQMTMSDLSSLASGSLQSSAINVTDAEGRELKKLVGSLDPAPGRAFDPPEPVARFPELEFRPQASGGLSVELVNDPLLRLGIDRDLAASGESSVNSHLLQAKALLRSVKFRGQTLLAVGGAILAAQEAYFSGRSPALEPLTRSAVADQLGLHKTTVGRAISGKSLIWEGRIMALDKLFPAAVSSGGKEPASSHAAQVWMTQMVAEETPDSVMSDAAICTKLKDRGVDISRRTVAKYRGCLNIPSSSARRRLLRNSAARRRKP